MKIVSTSPRSPFNFLALKTSIFLVLFGFLSTSLIAQSVWTDKLDYQPGETAYASGSGWAEGEQIVLNVHEVPVNHPDVVSYTTADENGNFSNVVIYNFDLTDFGSSFTLTATGEGTPPNTAFAYFTDGGITYEQWETIGHGMGTSKPNWFGGIANSGQASYLEGDVTPHRVRLTGLDPDTTYGIIVDFDYYQSTSNAGGRLYLDEYDTTIDGGGDSDWVASGTLTADGSYTFTANEPIGANYTSPQLTFYLDDPDNDGNLIDITTLTYQIIENPPTGDTFRRAEIIFTTGNFTPGTTTDVDIYYGLRLALPGQAYAPVSGEMVDGSGGFTGGSLQTKIEGDETTPGTINDQPSSGVPVDTWITPSSAIQLAADVVQRGEVSGFKWNDADGDAVWDNGEDGLGGWTIELYLDDGDEIFEPGNDDILYLTTITSDGLTDVNGDGTVDPIGYYEFSSAAQPLKPLLPGTTYFIQEESQPGWDQNFPSVNNYWGPLEITATTTTYSGADGDAEQPNFGNENVCIPPTITTQPTNDSVCVGDGASFSVTATGTSLTYQWEENGIDLANGGVYSGIDTATLNISDATGLDGNTYQVVITESLDCTTTSDTVTLTVNDLPATPTTSNLTYCVGDTPAAITTAVTGTTGTLAWYSDAAGTASISEPTIDTSSASISTYYVTQTDANTCESETAAVVVTVNALPATPTTSNLTYCVDDTPAAITTAVTGTTGTLAWYSDAAGTASISEPTIDTSSASINTYYVTQTDGNTCESETAAVVVTVNALPATPTTSNLTYCVDDTPAAITTAVTGTTGTLAWYSDAAGTASISEPTIDTSSASINTYYVTQTDANTCESETAAVVVTVNALPATPTTSNLTYCVDDTPAAITTAVTGTTGTLAWYSDAAGTASISEPTIDTSSASINTYYVTQTDANTCESETAAVVVTVNALPATPTTSNLTYCVDDTPAAITTAVTGTTGTLAWYSDAAGTASISEPTIDTSSASISTYYVTQTDANTCESETAAVVVTVNALPATPTTSNLTYCVDDTPAAITTAVTGTTGTLAWYSDAAGTASISEPTIDTSSASVNTYYVTQTDANTCESETAAVVVTVNALPATPTTSNLTYCVDDTPAAITTAVTGTTGTLAWYSDAAGTASISEPTIDTSSASVSTYYVTQTDGTTTCESATAAVVVTVNALPATPTTSNLTYCVDDTPAAITTAVTGTTGTLAWYSDAAGTASISEPTIDTSSASINTYYVTQTDGNTCESETAAVVVTVNALPATPTTSNLTYCVDDTPAAITTAVTGTTGTLAWYSDAAGTASISEPTIDTSSASINTYYVTQTDANTCESETAAVVVTVNALPATPTTSNLTYCVDDTPAAITTAVTGTTGTLAWYSDAAGTASISEPTIDTSSASINTYYVTQTDANTCESETAAVVVTVNALPATPTTSNLTYCVDDTPAAITTAVTGTTGTLAWYSDAAGTASISEPTIDTSSASISTYYVTQTDGNTCESETAAVVVTVNALPATPTTSNLTYCVDDTPAAITTAVTGTTGTLAWYSDAAGTASISEPTIDTSSASVNTYYVTQTDGTTTCESATAAVVVTVNALPATPTTSNLTYCVDDTPAAITTAVTGTTGTLAWYSDAAGTASISEPTIDTSSASINTYYVTQTDANTCESETAAVVVTVNALPATPTTSNLTYCVDDTPAAITTAVTGTTGTLAWYSDAAGTASISEPTIDTSSASINTYYVTQTDGNTCESETAAVVVTVNALPATPTTSNLTYCVDDTPAAITTAVTGTTGTLAWYSDAAGTASISEPTIDTSSASINTYYVTQTDGNTCESETAAVVVTVNALPATPTTSNLTYCVDDTPAAITTAVTGTTGTLAWYSDAAGTASISEPTIDTSSASINTYYVTQTDANTCESETAAVVVTVNALPATPTTSNLTYCVDDTPAAITTAVTGTTGTLAWYSDAAGTASISEPTIDTSSASINTYYVTQTDANTCESETAAVVVTVNALPATPTTSNLTYCVDDTPAAITTAVTGTTGTLAWYSDAAGTASISEPTIDTSSASINTYYVTQTDGNTCESETAAVVVTVNALPATPTTSNLTYCVDDTPAAITTAVTGTTGTLAWYSDAAGTASISEPTIDTSSASINTYYVTQTDGNTCESETAAVVVTVNALPATPTTSNLTYCVDDTPAAITTAVTGTTGTLAWYSDAAGTASISEPTIDTSSASINTYYVTQTDGNTCESETAAVVVTVNALPATPTTSNLTYCVDDTPAAITTAVTGTTGTLAWYSDAAGTASISEPTIDTSSASINTYYVTQTDANTCESETAAVVVTVNALPATPTTSNLTYCVDDTPAAITTAVTGTTGTLAWYSDAAGTASISEPTIDTSSASINTYYVTQTDANTCESETAAVVVTVNALPATPTTSNLTYCVDDTPAAITTAVTGTTGTLAWYSDAAGTASISEPTIDTSSASVNTYYVTQTDGTTTCESATAAVVVTVNALPTVTFTAPADLCVDAGLQAGLGGGLPAGAGGVYSGLGVSDDGNGTSYSFDPVAAGVGVHTITYTYTDGNTCTNSATDDVEVFALPTITIATAAACSADLLTYSISVNVSAGTVTSMAGGTVVDNTGGNWTISGITAGTDTTLTVTDINGCDQTLMVTAPDCSCPVVDAPTSGGDQEVCDAGQTLTATATVDTDEVVDWYAGPAGGTTVTPELTGVGTVTYYAEARNTITNCVSSTRTAVTLTINALPATPTTSNLTYCVDDTPAAITTAVTGTTGTLAWYSDAAGTASISEPTIDTSSASINTYYVTQTDGNTCESETAAVVVTVNALPATPTTSNLTYCVDDTPAAITTAVTGTTGTLAWYSDAAGTASISEPTIDTSSASINTYYVTQTDANTCESETAAVVVTVNALPATPTTSNLTYCVDDTPAAITTAVTGTTGTLAWYSDAAGTASISEPTIDTSSASINTYYVTQTDGNTCESETAAVVVTVNALPATPTTSNLTYCVDDTPAAITTAVTGTTGTLAWYSDAAGTASISEPTIDTSSASINTYYVTQTDGNTCESETAAVVVTVNALPATPTTSNLTYCVDDTPAAITTAVTGTTGTLAWYSDAAGTASISEPTIDTSSASINTYYVTQTDANTCESETAAVVVTVNALPATPTTSNLTYCVDDTPAAITTAVTGTTGTLAWYSDAAGTASISEPTIDTSSASINTYYVTQTDANTCESETAAVVVTVNALPATPTTSNLTYCVDDTPAAITTAVTGTTGTLAWYSDAAGTASISEPTIDTSSASVNTYYVTQTDGTTTCESATAAVVVTVNALPTVTFTAPADLCVDAGLQAGLGGGLPAGAGGVYSGLGVSDDGNGTSYSFDPEVAGIETHVITYTYTDGNGCTNSATDDVEVFALPTITIATAAACSADLLTYSISVNVSAGTVTSMAGGTVVDNTGGNWTISGITAGTDTTLTVTDINGCDQTLMVTAPDCSCPVVDAPTSGGDQEVCDAGQTLTATATVDTDEVVDWYAGPAGGTTVTPELTGVGTVTYYAEARNTITNCVSSTRTAVTLTINALPATPTTSNLTYCVGDTPAAITTAVTGTTGTLAWYSDAAGTTSIAEPTISTTSASVNTYYVTQTDGTTTCESATAAVVVTVNALPTVTATADNMTVCAGDEVTLTGGGATSYSWDNGVTDGVAFVPTETTIYTVTGTDTNGCENTATVTVTVIENIVERECNVVGADNCGPDQMPYYNFYWFEDGSRYFLSDVNQTMTFTEYNNGTALIEGFTHKGNCVVELYIVLKNKKDWTTWSSSGGSLKVEGCSQVVQEDLSYYIIDGDKSFATVTGSDCEGEGTFKITHRPDPSPSPTYGVQVGPGAALFDSHIGADGVSGWAWMGPENDERKYKIDVNFILDCQEETECVIEYPNTLVCEIDPNILDVSSHGSNDGSATAIASGGATPYSYSWSNGETTAMAEALVAGENTVVITDVNGAKSYCSVTISEPGCTNPITQEYRINNSWQSGLGTIILDEGDDLVLSILPNGVGVVITLPDGTEVGDNYGLGNVTVADSGVYTMTSEFGCVETLEITVVDPNGPPPCTTNAMTQEYTVNGTVASGSDEITIDEGDELELSILPDGVGVVITLPDGTEVGDNYNIGSILLSQSGVYTMESEYGCIKTLYVTVVDPNGPAPCTTNPITQEYRINNSWQSGLGTIILDEGDDLVLSILPNGVGVVITLPDGTEVGDNYGLGNVTVADSGVYTMTSEFGCVETLEITVVDPNGPPPCTTNAMTQEYTVNGTVASGSDEITIDEGDELELSILPDGVGVVITLPDGTEVGDNYNIGSILLSQSGVYTMESEYGCIKTLYVTVVDPNGPAPCTTNPITQEYRINNSWQSGLEAITLDEGDDLVLSILPNGVGVVITLPDGTKVGDDYRLGNVTVADSGIYTMESEFGCVETLEITVVDPNGPSPCTTNAMTQEYTVNGTVASGSDEITIDEGDELELSILPDGVGVVITLPDGTEVGDNYNIGSILLSQSGVYTMESEFGCIKTLYVTVVDPNGPAPCTTNPITQEYRINNSWQSGLEAITLDEGDDLVLSILPNGVGVVITLPDGTEVGDDYSLGNVTVVDSGVYTMESEFGCVETLEVTVVDPNGPPPCTTNAMTQEYTVNGTVASGSDEITIDEGDELELSILPDGVGVVITLPDGTEVGDNYNIGSILLSQSGVYTMESEFGCIKTLYVTVVDPNGPAPCTTNPITQEYRINNSWQSGLEAITLDEGDDLVLSILPNGVGVVITLPDGTEVGDDFRLGNVTVADSGVYTMESEFGCIKTLDVTVVNPNGPAPCTTNPITQEYRINNSWQSGLDEITINEGDNLVLSILPNGVGVVITLPDGTEVGDDYGLGNVTVADSGVYTMESEFGCVETLDVTVVDPLRKTTKTLSLDEKVDENLPLLKVIPNPAQEFVDIYGYIGSKIEIISVLGVTIKTINNTASSRTRVHLDGIPNGVYFVRNTNNDRVETKRLVID